MFLILFQTVFAKLLLISLSISLHFHSSICFQVDKPKVFGNQRSKEMPGYILRGKEIPSPNMLNTTDFIVFTFIILPMIVHLHCVLILLFFEYH